MAIGIGRARAAKASAKARLERVPEVVGIGLTKIGDDYALKVNLRCEVRPRVSLPERIDGVRVCVEVVGAVRRQG
jgi:hypothetical protein